MVIRYDYKFPHSLPWPGGVAPRPIVKTMDRAHGLIVLKAHILDEK